MGLGKAEYQNLFNAKGTAEKNYKIRERIADFLWKEMPLTLVLTLAFALPAVTSERPPKTATKPGRQAWAATGGKEGEAPCA